jgi:predicted nuclease of predicted toxin-antitoxin system
MKILPDECVTKKLKKYTEEFEVFTVRELGLSGIKNGQLMAYCVENKIDILLTIDKNLVHQQNLEKYPLTIVVLKYFTNKIEELITFLPSFKLRVEAFQKHKAYIIDKSAAV